MDDTLLRERLRESEQRNEALSREVASLRATLDCVLEEFGAFRRDYEALVDATRIITAELGERLQDLSAVAAWLYRKCPPCPTEAGESCVPKTTRRPPAGTAR